MTNFVAQRFSTKEQSNIAASTIPIVSFLLRRSVQSATTATNTRRKQQQRTSRQQCEFSRAFFAQMAQSQPDQFWRIILIGIFNRPFFYRCLF